MEGTQDETCKAWPLSVVEARIGGGLGLAISNGMDKGKWREMFRKYIWLTKVYGGRGWQSEQKGNLE